MALENIVSPALRRRWLITFGFGLVHGFGFSFALRDTLQFAGSHLLTSLLSFNVGVELGQLLVLAAGDSGARRCCFATACAERIGTIVLSAIVAHTGWHWMTERGGAAGAISVRVAGVRCRVSRSAAAVGDAGRWSGRRRVVDLRRPGETRAACLAQREERGDHRRQYPEGRFYERALSGMVVPCVPWACFAARLGAQAAGAHQHCAQSVQDGRAVPQDAGRAHVGIDERGRHRPRRAQHLGGRALRREQLSRSRDGQMSSLPSILKFDASGKLVTSFGAGHADLSARHPRRSRRQRLGDRRTGRCAAARRSAPRRQPNRARCGPLPGSTRGHQVFKFSPDGKLLMTLGKAGGAAAPGLLLSAERRARGAERRHLRLRRARRRERARF